MFYLHSTEKRARNTSNMAAERKRNELWSYSQKPLLIDDFDVVDLFTNLPLRTHPNMVCTAASPSITLSLYRVPVVILSSRYVDFSYPWRSFH